MHIIATIIAALLLIPAALAGIRSGLIDILTHFDCLSAALSHASALLAEITPLAPAAGMLLAGIASLAMAAWLIVRGVNA